MKIHVSIQTHNTEEATLPFWDAHSQDSRRDTPT